MFYVIALLEKFEIALQLDGKLLLVPSQLPEHEEGSTSGRASPLAPEDVFTASTQSSTSSRYSASLSQQFGELSAARPQSTSDLTSNPAQDGNTGVPVVRLAVDSESGRDGFPRQRTLSSPPLLSYPTSKNSNFSFLVLRDKRSETKGERERERERLAADCR